MSDMLDAVVPMVRDPGVTHEQIDQILVKTPKRLLTFEQPH